MTIYDFRKIIIVQEVRHDASGVSINYTLSNAPKSVSSGFAALAVELIAIGSVESECELHDGYKLSQWDALNIAIRHEYKKHIDSELEYSDIFKALGNIINPNK